jgi:hypothetical protein
VTALALAGTGGGAVLPDLVLPPGFDRVGDVVRFDQDEAGAQGGTAQSAPLGEVDIVQPAATNLAPPPRPARGPYHCKACGEVGHQARTCSGSAGEVADEGEADDDADPDCTSTNSLKPADLIPCTRCGLRGHVAGDPDRCLYYHGSLGMGGQSWSAQQQGPATWAGRGPKPQEGAVRPARGP